MKTLMKISILLVVLFLSLTVYSQDKITGKIVDTENIAIPYANVIIEGTNIGTITNTEGLFTLKKNSSPKCSILVSCLGYNSYKLDIEKEKEFPVQIILEQEIFNLT